MSPELIEIFKAVLGTLGTVAVAAIGLIGVIYSARKPSRDKPPVGNTGKALQEFNGTQNEFMSLVIADNKSLRDDLSAMSVRVDDIKMHQDNFLNAVRRYLMKLATAWSSSEPMPWPDDEDFHILEDTLPHKRAGIVKKRRDQ